MPEIRVGVIGVGNCCSALIQGVEFYKKHESEPLGLLHWDVGGYLPSDLRFVVAFDVDRRKVGKDLSQAIFAEPNNVPHLIDVPSLGASVLRGPTLDGVGEYTKELIKVDERENENVAEVLRKHGVRSL